MPHTEVPYFNAFPIMGFNNTNIIFLSKDYPSGVSPAPKSFELDCTLTGKN
jgi:hypothetical protein